MRDIGTAVNMDYGCGSSGAYNSSIVPAFKNSFGYSYASSANYNYQTVKNELNASRPVLLSGGRKVGWWIFAKMEDGHAWVCDGYLSHVDPCWGSTLRFHMNWGWVNTGLNGWYYFNNFNPEIYTFNYDTKMTYNIIP